MSKVDECVLCVAPDGEVVRCLLVRNGSMVVQGYDGSTKDVPMDEFARTYNEIMRWCECEAPVTIKGEGTGQRLGYPSCERCGLYLHGYQSANWSHRGEQWTWFKSRVDGRVCRILESCDYCRGVNVRYDAASGGSTDSIPWDEFKEEYRPHRSVAIPGYNE